MSTTRIQRPGWSLVVVGVLFLLLGTAGGAVSAALVTGADIKDGTITTKDVKDRSLRTADLAKKTVGDLTGPRGPAGPAGTPGQAGYQQVDGPAAVVNPGQQLTLVIACPAGTTSLGGFVTSEPGGIVSTLGGGPSDVDEWSLPVFNPTDSPLTASGHATCTRP